MKKSIIIFITAAFVISASGNDPAGFTAEHLWQMRRAGAPVVSPDGSRTLFTLTGYDLQSNESSTFIYLLNNETGEKKQITFTGRESSPFWCPEGKHIGFLSRRDGNPAQVYIMEHGWGEARKITGLPVGVFAPRWFPDGKRIAFAANIHPNYNGCFDRLEDIINEQRDSKVTAKVTENVMYRFWDRWLTDGFFPRLFSVDITSGEVTDLMPGTSNFFAMMGGVSYDISPDGQEIAVSMNSIPEPFEKLNYDIFLLPADGSGEMRNITTRNPADDTNPVYSPCGTMILYGRQNQADFYADNVQMVVYDRYNETHHNITADIDLSCEQWQWSHDGSTIFFHAQHNAKKPLFSIPSGGGSHTILFDEGNNNSLQVTPGGSIIFTHDNLNSPADIYITTQRGGNARQLTSVNKDLLEAIKLGNVENVTYKGANGADIQMYIVYPPGFDPDKKYPLVLMIHGGPHSIFGDQWHYRWNAHLFAEPGYVMALPNFHGSTSFGQEFARSIHGSHADLPFRDIMKATDYMIGRGFIDETRMAATGGSYGGYMVSWIAGHTDRYACLVNHAGVYNIHMQFSADYTWYRPHQYSGSPWENFDRLMEANPAMFAHNFSTPMLIIHGELDYRVPVGHGLLVYGIYKRMGLDARLIYYPDENHWILSPRNSVFWYDEFLDWLARYLD
ncbi:MAG: S9 family peptidase [Marinilabiliales bacterium]|nr:MAG: S9 family peptidase [Marinilabiliales bacterium]